LAADGTPKSALEKFDMAIEWLQRGRRKAEEDAGLPVDEAPWLGAVTDIGAEMEGAAMELRRCVVLDELSIQQPPLGAPTLRTNGSNCETWK
jgi:hypothetical protein